MTTLRTAAAAALVLWAATAAAQGTDPRQTPEARELYDRAIVEVLAQPGDVLGAGSLI